MKRIIFLSVLLGMFNVGPLSADTGSYGKIKARFLNLEAKCLNESIMNDSCHYQTDSVIFGGEDYGAHPVQNIYLGVLGTKDEIYNKMIKRPYRETGLYGKLKPSYKVAKDLYDDYLDKVVRFSKSNKLNTEEKIKLTLCTSANMIEYKKHSYNDTQTDHDPYLIAKRGYGMCRQFSTIAYDVAKALGLKTRKAYNPGHAFISFKVEYSGKKSWFAAEPQQRTCRLIKQ